MRLLERGKKLDDVSRRPRNTLKDSLVKDLFAEVEVEDTEVPRYPSLSLAIPRYPSLSLAIPCDLLYTWRYLRKHRLSISSFSMSSLSISRRSRRRRSRRIQLRPIRPSKALATTARHGLVTVCTTWSCNSLPARSWTSPEVFLDEVFPEYIPGECLYMRAPPMTPDSTRADTVQRSLTATTTAARSPWTSYECLNNGILGYDGD